MSDATGQPPGTPPPQTPPPAGGQPAGGSGGGSGMDPNLAGLLTYLAGWLTGILFLLIEKDNKFVRFHAWQSTITFAILMVFQVIWSLLTSWTCVLPIVTLLAMMGLWIFLMVKAYQGEKYKLPVIGDWAEKQN